MPGGGRQGGEPCLAGGTGPLIPYPEGGSAEALPHLGQGEREAERSLGAAERTGSLRPLTEKGLRSPWVTLLERGLLVWAGVGPPGASGRRWLPSRRMH